MREAEEARACSKAASLLLLLLLLLLQNRVLRGLRILLPFVRRVNFPEFAGFHQGVL